MRRSLTAFAVLALSLALTPAVGAHPDLPQLPALPAQPPHDDGDGHHEADETPPEGEHMALLANYDADGTYREGSDLAFWGTTAVLGNYGNPGGFRLMDISQPRAPELLGQFVCPGPQADVSIWQELVFLSVDTPQAGPECGAGSAGGAQYVPGQAWEGIRIVSIENPAEPVQIATVDTDCGSHTHTLVPDLSHREDGKPAPRVLIYVSSYPLGGQGVECNAATHRKISVVEVPLRDPASASVVATPDVSPAVGCHDISVLPAQNLAAAACISETQLWDISDPAAPVILSHIVNPAMEIHHSTAFSWDGETLVIGDEMGGAAAAAGCMAGGHAPTGSLWFYDISDPAAPAQQGWYTIPQDEPGSLFCTAHNFNVVPLRDSDRDVLVTAWYNGGTHVLDFTDPADVAQLAWIKPAAGAAWSSYWYNGHVYANNFDTSYVPSVPSSRGFDVFSVDTSATEALAVLDQAMWLTHLNPQTQTMAHPPAHAPAHGRRR
jgi:hypothetical protein